jgi:vacuolar protein sorting-associated protein 52
MNICSLMRLRQEVVKLITNHTEKTTDVIGKATAQATFYEFVLQVLSKGPQVVSHPKVQSEVAFWKEREEQARRRVQSSRRQG